MYKRYVFERYSHGEEKKTIHETVDYEPVKIRQTSVLDTVKTVARLSDNHPVKKYLEGRKIPTEHWNDLYLVNQFCTFVNKIIPNKFPNVDQDHPRLVIPFRDKTGKLVGFQGRAFGKEKPKYLTIMLEEAPKIFGLDKVNMSDVVYVVEGPIDSLFVDNSIAMAGADISVYEIYPTAKFVYIYDNEPRNPEIVKRMNKVIERGDSIVVWPNNIGEKDINDMIIAGKSKSDVFDIISRNTQNGLSAKIKFTEWKKCE